MRICHILHHSFTQMLGNYVTSRSVIKQCKCFCLEQQILHISLRFCTDDGIIAFLRMTNQRKQSNTTQNAPCWELCAENKYANMRINNSLPIFRLIKQNISLIFFNFCKRNQLYLLRTTMFSTNIYWLGYIFYLIWRKSLIEWIQE